MAKHRVPITKRQPGMASRPLMRYEQNVQTITLGSSSAGDDFGTTLFDNSSRAGNKNCKVGKMTIQWWLDMNQANLLYIFVYKGKEGATLESGDSVDGVRDMKSEGRMIRAPWQICTRAPGAEAANILHQRKTIVITDILLDPNDDIKFGITTRKVSTTGTNDCLLFWKTFWKVTE